MTAYVYDGFGNVIQTTSPDTGVTVYEVDLAGNRTKHPSRAPNLDHVGTHVAQILSAGGPLQNVAEAEAIRNTPFLVQLSLDRLGAGGY